MTTIDNLIDLLPAQQQLPFARKLLRVAGVLSPMELNVYAALLHNSITAFTCDASSMVARTGTMTRGSLRVMIMRIRQKLGHELTIIGDGKTYKMVMHND